MLGLPGPYGPCLAKLKIKKCFHLDPIFGPYSLVHLNLDATPSTWRIGGFPCSEKMEEEEEEANFEGFLKWAAAIGISDSPISHSPSSFCLGYSLSVSHFPEAGGRGLAATRFIRKGELILRVPKAALMTSDCLIGKDQKLSAALKKYPLLSSTQVNDSKYRRLHLQLLPNNFLVILCLPSYFEQFRQ
ncbi:hypothetical protein CDL12_11292 [Handroanthus impetiginosus]|uniref:Uncharacterized protein n=1 Tax=Handroanthus impetiginosus TaxID=429701 RepID=A0A2G9HET6_9LAMI|nr:hypothetical protein CDL12_11292 [Handroanthus impetiginosus]